MLYDVSLNRCRKDFNNSPHLWLKTLPRRGRCHRKENIPDITKSHINQTTKNIILNGEKSEEFPLRVGTRQEFTL